MEKGGRGGVAKLEPAERGQQKRFGPGKESRRAVQVFFCCSRLPPLWQIDRDYAMLLLEAPSSISCTAWERKHPFRCCELLTRESMDFSATWAGA